MNTTMFKLYRDGKEKHNKLNPNNIALSANEQINLHLSVSNLASESN